MIKNVQDILESLADKLAGHQLDNRELEHRLLEVIAIEINEKQLDQPTWLKAFSDGGGDEARAKALYIKYRLKRLTDHLLAARLQTRHDDRVRREHERGAELKKESLIDGELADAEEARSIGRRVLIGLTAAAVALCGTFAFMYLAIDDGAAQAASEETYAATEPYQPEEPAEELSGLVSNPTFQPSFDCGQVSNPAEELICGDGELARQDVEMASLYGELRGSLSRKLRGDLRSNQVRWLAERNACATVSCIRASYARWFSTNSVERWGLEERATRHSAAVVAPIINGSWSYYRTRIVEGWDSESTLDGRYVIIRIGCGTGCTFNLVGDHVTGRVYDLGLGGEEMQMLELQYSDRDAQLRAQWEDYDSDSCQRQSYVWSGEALVPTSPLESQSRGAGCPPLI